MTSETLISRSDPEVSDRQAMAANYLSYVINSNGEDTTWKEAANCRDNSADLFYATEAIYINFALDICGGCLVKQACDKYADLTKQEHGIWGGVSEGDRRRQHKTQIV
jgi:WhiB family redox-sensing transcriptional regulator